MLHRRGRLLCRSGILHDVRRCVVPGLEKNPRELTVQAAERLASERRWTYSRCATGMTIKLLVTCQTLLVRLYFVTFPPNAKSYISFKLLVFFSPKA